MATGIPIFSGCIAEWNELQVEFVSWCHFYNSIYSGYERPDNKTIENDELLDSWLRNKRSERHREEVKRKMQDVGTEDHTGISKEEYNMFDDDF